MKSCIKFILFSIIALACYAKAVEKTITTNYYTWNVTRVIDGDTFEVDALFFPRELGNVNVRIKGVDTPEKPPRAKCVEEGQLALKASAYTKLLLTGKTVIIKNVETDKYGGRIVADVFVSGRSVAELLVANGMARPYDGGTKQSWCSK